MKSIRHIASVSYKYIEAFLLVFVAPGWFLGAGAILFLPIELSLRHGGGFGIRPKILDILFLGIASGVIASIYRKCHSSSPEITADESPGQPNLVVTPRRLLLGFLCAVLAFVVIATRPSSWLGFFATYYYPPEAEPVGAAETFHFAYLLSLIAFAAIDRRGQAVAAMLFLYFVTAVFPFVDQISTSAAALGEKGRASGKWYRNNIANYRLRLARYSGGDDEGELECEISMEVREHAAIVETDTCGIPRKPVEHLFHEIERAFIFGSPGLLALEAVYDDRLGYPVKTVLYRSFGWGSRESARLPGRRKVPHVSRTTYEIAITPL